MRKEKGKGKNTVKVHKDVQEYSTDKTCGRENARMQEIVSPMWYHLVSVR